MLFLQQGGELVGQRPHTRDQTEQHRRRDRQHADQGKTQINKYGLQLAGVLPQDDTVYTYDCEGKPSSQVPDTAPVKKALAAIMQELKL